MRVKENTYLVLWFVYYEEIKRWVKRILIYGFRCNERLKDKFEGSTRLTYTGLLGGLEHLKIETRLIGRLIAQRFASVIEFIMNQSESQR